MFSYLKQQRKKPFEHLIHGLAVSKAVYWYLLKVYLDGRAGITVEDRGPDDVMFDMLQPVQNLPRERFPAFGIFEEFNTTLPLIDAALDMTG